MSIKAPRLEPGGTIGVVSPSWGGADGGIVTGERSRVRVRPGHP